MQRFLIFFLLFLSINLNAEIYDYNCTVNNFVSYHLETSRDYSNFICSNNDLLFERSNRYKPCWLDVSSSSIKCYDNYRNRTITSEYLTNYYRKLILKQSDYNYLMGVSAVFVSGVLSFAILGGF